MFVFDVVPNTNTSISVPHKPSRHVLLLLQPLVPLLVVTPTIRADDVALWLSADSVADISADDVAEMVYLLT